MNDPQCVIEIASDPELDAQIIDHYAPRRLVPDRRLNRPRDNMSRFVSASNAVGRNSELRNEGSDDDIEITREVALREDGPLNDDAEYINLDDYQNNGNGRVVVVPHTEGDDDLMLVEERIREPHYVTLQLPGGPTIQVNTSLHELPVSSSFQNQIVNDPNRFGRIRRHVDRARRMFMDTEADEESGSDADNESNYLPQDIRNSRNQSLLQRRMRDQRERQQRRQRLSRASNDEIESLDANLRSLFYESQSLAHFRNGLARYNFPPARLGHLLSLYTNFRARSMQNWASQRRTRSMTREGTGGGNRSSIENMGQTRSFTRRNLTRSVTGDYTHSSNGNLAPHELEDYADDLDNDPSGGAEFLHRMITSRLGRRFGGLPFGAGAEYGYFDDEDDPASTEYIIRMIQEREERDANTRTKKLNEITRNQQEKYIKKANTLPEGYLASFNTSPMMSMMLEKDGKEERVLVTDDVAAKTYEEVPVCVLCGVELGLGIPDDFKGIVDEDKGVSFEALQSKYKCHCPYQTLARPTQVDRDMSRRTFVSSCGHTFCGRCFVRIDNARSMNTKSKNKLKGLKGPSHPDNYGPKQCPAEGCKCLLRKRRMMREAYF